MLNPPKIPSAPVVNLRLETEASYLITTIPKAFADRHPISEIEVKAKEQPHISLGNFTDENPPHGFAIHISPNPDSEAIVTQATELRAGNKYELVLHVANYGSKAVTVEVWKL